MVTEPLLQFTLGITIAVAGVLIVARFLRGSWFERQLVLEGTAGGDSKALREEREAKLPNVGIKGIALTTLRPVGNVEIAGQRYEARCTVGSIKRGVSVRVVSSSDFDLVVEELPS